jgi:hypothetical protein
MQFKVTTIIRGTIHSHDYCETHEKAVFKKLQLLNWGYETVIIEAA